MRRDASPDSCEWVVSRLSAYLDGELNLELADHVTRHLAHCHSCERELDREGQLLTATYDALVPASLGGESVLPNGIGTTSRPGNIAPMVALGPGRLGPGRLGRGLAAATILVALLAFGLSGPHTRSDSASNPLASARSGSPQIENSPPLILIVKGDVDGDGELTSADLPLLARLLSANPELAADVARCPAAGDFDDDGELTPNDYALTARSLYGEQLLNANPAVPLAATVAYDPGLGLACDYVCP